MTALALVFLFAPTTLFVPAAEAAPLNGWAPPMDLIPSTSESYANDLAVDRSGGAMVVWSEWTGSATVAMYKRFVSGVGWQPSQSLGNGEGTYISVAASPLGDYFAAWTWWNGTGYTITYRRYTAEWGWGSQVNLSSIPITTYLLDTAMDGTGNAYLVANGYNGTGYQTWAARINAGLFAQGPVQLGNNVSNATYEPSVVASRATGAWFTWEESNGITQDIYAARQTGGTFAAAQLIDDLPDYAYSPALGVDDSGRVMLAWIQWAGSSYSIRYAQWNGAWSATGLVNNSMAGYNIVMRMTPGGAATILFNVYAGPDAYDAVIRWYPGDGQWTGYSKNTENTTVYWTYHTLAVDSGANPIVIYPRQIGSAYPLRAAQVSGTNWAFRTYLQDDNMSANNATYAHAEVLSSGAALVVWAQYMGARWVLRANILHPMDVTPPWVRIATPLTGDVSAVPSITVTGWADPTASVWVNGAAATMSPDGYWVATIPAAEGWTWITATARDPAGNYGYSNGRMAFYQDPTHTRAEERASAGIAGPQLTANLDELNYWGAWWPRIKVAPNGIAYASWYEYVYPTNQIYVSRYYPGSGWENPIHLAGEEGSSYGGPEMAMDAGGNLTVMWGTNDLNGQWNHIWAFHYMAAGWTWAPYRVDNAQRWAYWPDVAASPDGRTLMVWDQRNETSQKFDSMASWWDPVNYTVSAPLVIENITNTTDGARVAFDGSGNANVAVRVWDSTGGTTTDLALIRYRPGSGWDNGTILANTTNPATFASIDTDRAGNTTLSWLRGFNPGPYYQLNVGRVWANLTWSGTRVLWNNSWTWDPEVMAVDNGYAFVAETANDINGTPDALVAAILPGQFSANMTRMDNTTGWGGGPKLSKGYADGTVKAHWDEYENVTWRANMRSYNFTTASWSANTRLVADDRGGNIPDLAPMPDGGFMGVWLEYNASMGSNQVVGRRFTPPDVTPPALNVTTPANGTTVNNSTVRVAGVAEPGRPVLINGISVWVEANGSFGVDIALVNGTNVIRASSWDQYGNTVWVNRTVIYDNPERRRIDQLEAANAALQNQLNVTQAQLNLTNSSLWQALAGQNASLLAALAAQNSQLMSALQSGDAQLLAQLVAQNTSLLNTINGLNQSLLASLAAQNTALTDLIADTNASLLAELAAQDASLTQLIADTNATLLAQLAAQDSALLQKIASTNATLFAALAAQNASLVGQLGSLNASLLAAMAAGDASLTAQIAATNASLLASLAAQNSTLMDAIASTNASLLAKLALTNSTLWAKLMADNGALWAELNLSAAETAAVAASAASTQSGLDSTNLTVKDEQSALSNTRQDLSATTSTAQGANTMATLGLALAGAALLVGLVALMMWRKNKPQNTLLTTDVPPPVGQVTVPHESAAQPAATSDDEML